MRIALIGSAAFGEAVLGALREAGEEIVAVSAPPGPEGRPDALWAAARSEGLPLFHTGRLKRPEVLDEWAATQPDLCVMAFVTHILPERVLEAPKQGTIQYHPSLLPRHRGRSAINWAIRMGDAKTGVSIFWVDEGIDTGPVLLQKEVDIRLEDSVGSLYFDRLFPLGVEALAESVRMVRDGSAPRVVQDESQATYEPPADDSNSAIAWSRPAREVYDLVRGSDPQPGAHARVGGASVRLYDASLSDVDAGAAPGTIVGAGNDGLRIALDGGVLHVKRVQAAGAKKQPASEWAQASGAGEGGRFEDGAA
jgi:methionyl-tRNA formyltransferase